MSAPDAAFAVVKGFTLTTCGASVMLLQNSPFSDKGEYMPQHGHGSNGHLGISHPFGAKHGTPGTGYRTLLGARDRAQGSFPQRAVHPVPQGRLPYGSTLLGAPVAAQARPGAGARRPKTLLHASIPDWVPQRDSRGELPSVAEIMRRHAESDHADARPWKPDVVAEEPYYQVAVRPLALGREYENSKYIKPLSYQKKIPMRDFHFEHVQFIGNDGNNFGLSKGGSNILVEEKSSLGHYVVEPVKLRKEYIDRARDELELRWQEKALAAFRENPSRKLTRYDVKKYNCQHYVAEVLRLAASYETRERPLILP